MLKPLIVPVTHVLLQIEKNVAQRTPENGSPPTVPSPLVPPVLVQLLVMLIHSVLMRPVMMVLVLLIPINVAQVLLLVPVLPVLRS